MKRILILGVLLTMSAAHAKDGDLQSLENISQELVKVRQQIESLHNEINFEKEKYKDQVRSYASQKSDLGVRISRSELNIKDMQRELKKLTDRNQEKNRSHADIMPVLKAAVSELRASVSASLPFKLDQRLAALDDIESRMNTGIITPNKAANQLWAFIEDELVLGRSSGLYNDTVTINGQDRLVKVLRLGKVAMFYRMPDERYGVLRQEQGEWHQSSLDDSDSIVQLDRLFDSFNKNIRNGQFEIPNFLPRS